MSQSADDLVMTEEEKARIQDDTDAVLGMMLMIEEGIREQEEAEARGEKPYVLTTPEDFMAWLEEGDKKSVSTDGM